MSSIVVKRVPCACNDAVWVHNKPGGANGLRPLR
jgi:hypothetical protein